MHYQEHAVQLGVPAEAILVEPRATNTGANMTLSREVLAGAGLYPTSALLICKPYAQRRSFATAAKVWPELEVVCASEPLSLPDYMKSIGDENLVIDMIVGDLQRVIEYPKQGFATEQDVPLAVGTRIHASWSAGSRAASYRRTEAWEIRSISSAGAAAGPTCTRARSTAPAPWCGTSSSPRPLSVRWWV